MRNRIALLFLLCCMSVQMTSAQDLKEAIREHYTAVKQMIANYAQLEADGEKYPVNECYKVKVKQNLPGTGLHEEDVLMYYSEVEGSDMVYPAHRLEYVSVCYNFAAAKYYQEYLFDKNGHITFIYALNPNVEDGMEHEFRFYFDKGKLFDALVKSRKVGKKDFSQDYSGKTLPLRYHTIYQKYADEIAKYGRLFEAIDGATHH